MTYMRILTTAVFAASAAFALAAQGQPPSTPPQEPPRQSNEVVFGMINFKLGRHVLPLTTSEEVRAWFAGHPDSYVLARAPQARKLPPELLRELLFAWDETGRRASPYALLVRYPQPR